jgi:hypothetical protein
MMWLREKVSFVDAYKLWSEFTTDGDELKKCLSSEIDHAPIAKTFMIKIIL